MAPPLLLVPSLKKTTVVDLCVPLRQYIEKNYSVAEAKMYEEDIKRLGNLRGAAVTINEITAQSLTTLRIYYQHLTDLEARVNFSDLNLNFVWCDSFKEHKMWDKTLQAKSKSIALERSGILFNIGSVLTNLGINMFKTGGEANLKAAGAYLQQAAQAFTTLRDEVSVNIPEKVTMDLTRESLTMLICLTMGWAAKCVHAVARLANKPAALLAKLLAETHTHFFGALQMLSSPNLRQHIPLWFDACLIETLLVEVHVHYQIVLSCGEIEFGRILGHLVVAFQLLNDADKAAKGPLAEKKPEIQRWQELLKPMYEKNEHSNRVVANQPVTPREKLDLPVIMNVVRPLPFPELTNLDTAQSQWIAPIMKGLVPAIYAQAATEYKAKLTGLINENQEKMRQGMEEAKAALLQMHLPSSLEAVETTTAALPPRIVTKLDTIRSQGGVGRIHELILQSSQLATVDEGVIKECSRELEKEENEDNEKRQQFGAMWSRSSSASLNKTLKADVEKYQTKLSMAREADKKVERRLQTTDLSKLNASLEELEAPLKGTVAEQSSQTRECVAQLRGSIAILDELFANREQIWQAMLDRSKQEDIIQELLSSGLTDKDGLIASRLEQFSPFTADINENLTRQKAILQQITVQNEAFVRTKSVNEAARKAESTIAELDALIQVWEELSTAAIEGINFYTNLQDCVNRLRGYIGDFSHARGIEKRDLVAHLTSQLGAMSTQAVAEANMVAAMETTQISQPQPQPAAAFNAYPGVAPAVPYGYYPPPGGTLAPPAYQPPPPGYQPSPGYQAPPPGYYGAPAGYQPPRQ